MSIVYDTKIADCREQIQNDLSALLCGFNVDKLENNSGDTLEELACQIVIDRFQELGCG